MWELPIGLCAAALFSLTGSAAKAEPSRCSDKKRRPYGRRGNKAC